MAAPANDLTLNTSRGFPGWLRQHQISVAFTTYEVGKLFLIGLQSDKKVSVFERTLTRCMGLHYDAEAQSLYVSTLYQIWKFVNALQVQQRYQEFDAVFLPQASWVTGDLDIHDLALDAEGNLLFVNTKFSCLAKASERYSFEHHWHPPFISKLAAEDRCHLNGMAMEKGKPKFVSALSTTDVYEGWRDHREAGGVVLRVSSGKPVCTGLSMPHSPRLYREKLWLHHSGTGYFGHVDLRSRKFKPLCFCPGYLRGLDFVDNYAIVGLSKPRENNLFTGLRLDEELKERKITARCGLMVINLDTGDIEHSLTLKGIVNEIYDVAILPGLQRPMAIGFQSEEIKHVVSFDQ